MALLRGIGTFNAGMAAVSAAKLPGMTRRSLLDPSHWLWHYTTAASPRPPSPSRQR